MKAIEVDWPAPSHVKTFISCRKGGVSEVPFNSFNLGDHVGDDPQAVTSNRALLSQFLPQAPIWLQQVHGIEVVEAQQENVGKAADASYSQQSGQVCAVLTADCLPVLFCDRQGTQVAAAHAGWRGLLDGILEVTVNTFSDSSSLLVYLGPAIGPNAFEVGPEVKEAFCRKDKEFICAFKPSQNPGKWMANLYQLAKMTLATQGVTHVYGGEACTYSEASEYFSYRRDGQTGRMASCIWLEKG